MLATQCARRRLRAANSCERSVFAMDDGDDVPPRTVGSLAEIRHSVPSMTPIPR